jgi:hypothetical protein
MLKSKWKMKVVVAVYAGKERRESEASWFKTSESEK